MNTSTIHNQAQLSPGWYAIGFADLQGGEINWNGAPIYKYLGDGAWENDSGEPVDGFYDPHLQLTVTTDSADAYLPQ